METVHLPFLWKDLRKGAEVEEVGQRLKFVGIQ